MKRLIIICAIIGLTATAVSAQGEANLTNPNGLTIDTATNAAAEGPATRLAGYVKVVGFGLETTKISGTVAGKVYLQGATRSGHWLLPYLDSLTLEDASKNYRFEKTDPGFQYYRLTLVLSGGNASYRGTLYARKP